MTDWLVDLAANLQRNRDTGEGRPDYTEVHYGSLRAGVYEPRGTDPQKPHDQDEIYIIETGSGIFYRDGERQAFKPGDLIFVPVGMEHRFEEFPDDFRAWVAFWGPKGGEGAG